MSGGSFDYNCFRISQFADDLEARLHEHEMERENLDERVIEDPRVIQALREALDVIRIAGRLAHHIEWFFSGDHGEASFLRLYEADIKKWHEVKP